MTIKKETIDVEDATRRALAFVETIVGKTEPVNNMTVEEIERGKNGISWEITVGYDEPHVSTLASLAGSKARKYKRLRINSSSGDVDSMTIRNP